MYNNQEPIMPLPILVEPDSRLRKISELVDNFDDTLELLVETLFITMWENDGVGLAAPQVDVHKRVIVTDVPGGEPRHFVNPEIVATSGTQRQVEGCLSVPGEFATLPRFKRIRVKFQNMHGWEFVEEFEGLQSVCLEHEIDHLDGKLFTDYINNKGVSRYVARI